MTVTGRTGSTRPGQAAARRTRARRILAFVGMLTTIAGLVGLRAAVTPPPTQALSSGGLATQAGTDHASRGSSPARRSPGPGGAPAHRSTGGAPAHRSTGGGGAARSNRVVVGKAYDVSYGVVQLKVTMHGKRITDITPLSLPHGGRSSDISQYAAPQLRREALSAQSAHIDSVSGASYTSAGYARSLQSALDQSHS